MELVIGGYLYEELFQHIDDYSQEAPKFWFDSIDRCEVSDTEITLYGVCYSK